MSLLYHGNVYQELVPRSLQLYTHIGNLYVLLSSITNGFEYDEASPKVWHLVRSVGSVRKDWGPSIAGIFSGVDAKQKGLSTSLIYFRFGVC
jgi:hypothetical protein